MKKYGPTVQFSKTLCGSLIVIFCIFKQLQLGHTPGAMKLGICNSSMMSHIMLNSALACHPDKMQHHHQILQTQQLSTFSRNYEINFLAFYICESFFKIIFYLFT